MGFMQVGLDLVSPQVLLQVGQLQNPLVVFN